VQRQNSVGSIASTFAAVAAAALRQGTMHNFFWVYDLPIEIFAILMIAVFVGFYWAGLIFLRPILRQFVKNTRGANDIVGYVLSCFCVFYGLLLGLIAVTAYQNVAEAGANVTREASATFW